MSWLSHLSYYDLTYRVGWVLLHSVWQGALAAVMLLLLRRAVFKSAASRYLFSLLILMATVLAGIITGAAIHPQPQSINVPVALSLGDSANLHRQAAALPAMNAMRLPEAPQPNWDERRVLLAIVLVWAIGVTLLSVWQLGGWMILRHYRRTATPAGSELRQRLERLVGLMNVTRSVSIAMTTRLQIPIVIGVLRPVILVPVSLISELSPSQLEAILAHELAHVGRYDYLINLIQCAIETLMFYHPAIWWISKQIRTEREFCCDELAAKACGNPAEYGRALLALEECRSASRLAPAALGNGGKSGLFYRVRRLLMPSMAERLAHPRSWFIAVILLAFCLTMPFLVRWSIAQATKRAAVSQITIDLSNFTSVLGSAQYSAYLYTQADIIRSRPVLQLLLENPEIAALHTFKQANSDVIKYLQEHLQVEVDRKSDLIVLSIDANSAEDATKIVNAVRDAYAKYNKIQDQKRRDERNAVAVLEKADAKMTAIQNPGTVPANAAAVLNEFQTYQLKSIYDRLIQANKTVNDLEGQVTGNYPPLIKARQEKERLDAELQQKLDALKKDAQASNPFPAIREELNAVRQKDVTASYEYQIALNKYNFARAAAREAAAKYPTTHPDVIKTREMEERFSSELNALTAQINLQNAQTPSKPGTPLRVKVTVSGVSAEGLTTWEGIRKALSEKSEADRKQMYIELVAGATNLTVTNYFAAEVEAQKIVKELGLAYVSNAGLAADAGEEPRGLYYMGGHIKRGGVYSFSGHVITLRAAIISAGGFDELAGYAEITRHYGNGREYFLRASLAGLFNNTEQDIILKPDDQIIVSVAESPATKPALDDDRNQGSKSSDRTGGNINAAKIGE